MGRPAKINNPQVTERLCRAIALGSTYEMACRAAGIAYQTLRNYVRRAEQDEANGIEDSPYLSLLDALQKAEGEAVERWLAVIERAARGERRVNPKTGEEEIVVHPQWQAAAWKLERRYPQTYGRNLGVSGSVTVRDTFVDRVLEALAIEEGTKQPSE